MGDQDPSGRDHSRLDEHIEAAWLAFRVALADEISRLTAGQRWRLSLETPTATTATDAESDPVGAFDETCDETCETETWAGAEVARVSLALVAGDPVGPATSAAPTSAAPTSVMLTSAAPGSALVGLGWRAPERERPAADLASGEGSDAWSLEVPADEPDRLALLIVRTLREVHGCVHPAFCEHDPITGYDPTAPARGSHRADLAGLGVDLGSDPGSAGSDGSPGAVDRTPAAPLFPRDRAELVEAVDTALSDLLADVEEKDDEGDVPVRCGRSVLFVRVDDEKPLVELYAEVVHGVVEVDRLPAEIDALNRRHRFARFHTRDDVVIMRSELCAWPFAPTQLAVVLAELCATVEDVRRDLVARVGGSAFEEPDPEPDPRGEWPALGAPGPEGDLVSPLLVLTELLHEGPVPVRCVAEAFDRDRSAIIHAIVLVRRGMLDLDGHDPDTVLHLLRLALRLVVDGRAEIAAAPRPPRRRSEQASLLDDADLSGGALDLDWPG